MLALLASATKWEHSNLSLYVDDGTIYATSATEKATTLTATKRYEEVLQWLHRNGLQADLAKMGLMTFSKKKSTQAEGCTIGARYTNPITGPQHITAVNQLRFLGVFLQRDLNWMPHVKIMANHARSTIHGVSILGNSVQGLNFLNWRKVYNALVIPMLTYRASVWYTGVRQKGLIHHL